MELKKIHSSKHPGAIFLKIKKTKDDFICKIYPSNTANYIADTIIRALKDIELRRKNELSSSQTS